MQKQRAIAHQDQPWKMHRLLLDGPPSYLANGQHG